MSKYIKALQKAEELKRTPVANSAPAASKPPLSQTETKSQAVKRGLGINFFTMFVVIACTVTLYANVEAYLRSKKEQERSSVLISEQKQKIEIHESIPEDEDVTLEKLHHHGILVF